MIDHRFIVGGAFQALNAVEARHHFQADPARCELVFLVPPREHARAETWALIEATDWPNVRVAGPAAASFPHWVRRVRAHRHLRSESASLHRLVIGDYQTQLARHAAHGVRQGGEVVVLDDGAVTIRVAQYRAARTVGERPPRLHPQVSRPRYYAQRVAARLLGLRLDDLDAVTFFTIYDVAAAPQDSVVRHRFEWTRARFETAEQEDAVLFLGLPAVEVGMLAEADYTMLLRRLREHAGGRLQYRPHPREDRTRVRRLAADVGMEVLDLDTIVEYSLAARGRIPAEIVATHSTAIDTLRILFGDVARVRSVPLPLRLVPRRWHEFVTHAQREMDGRLGSPVERLELFPSSSRESGR